MFAYLLWFFKYAWIISTVCIYSSLKINILIKLHWNYVFVNIYSESFSRGEGQEAYKLNNYGWNYCKLNNHICLAIKVRNGINCYKMKENKKQKGNEIFLYK